MMQIFRHPDDSKRVFQRKTGSILNLVTSRLDWVVSMVLTTLFRTGATQQKQHTAHNYSIYTSVAISVYCCLHWCSHLTSIPPACIGVRTLHYSIAARYHSSSSLPTMANKSRLTRGVLRQHDQQAKTVSTTSDQDVGRTMEEILNTHKCRICGKQCGGPESLDQHWKMSGKCKQKRLERIRQQFLAKWEAEVEESRRERGSAAAKPRATGRQSINCQSK